MEKIFRIVLTTFLASSTLLVSSQNYTGSPYDMGNYGYPIDFGIDEDTLGPPPGNPFVQGTEGNWRIKRAYILQVSRTLTHKGVNDNVNLRTDGIYNIFLPFWVRPTETDERFWKIANADFWTYTVQVNHYNPFGGFELENVNPLGIYSASLYGYNHTLAVSVGANTRYREIGFDCFEDYNYSGCSNYHFGFQQVENIETKLSQSTAHSGRYSLRLQPKEKIVMKYEFVDCVDDSAPEIIK